MNDLQQFILLSIIVLNCALGLLVFAAGRRVAVNRQFLFLSMSLASWMGPCFMALQSTNPDTAERWIRIASTAGVFVPVFCVLLYQTIGHPDRSVREVLARGRFFLLTGLVFSLFSWSDGYITGALIGKGGIPDPEFGKLYHGYSLYFVGMLGYIMVGSVRGLRRTQGAQRLEFQFLIPGVLVFLVIAPTLVVVLPAATGIAQFVPYGMLTVLLTNCIIAYGIATKKILNVNVVARRAVCYGLLGIYLAGLYLGVWFGVDTLVGLVGAANVHIPHIVAAVFLVATMAPMRSFLSLFIERIFVRAHQEKLQRIIQRATADLSSATRIEDVNERFHEILKSAAGTDDITIKMDPSEREGIESLWDFLENAGGSLLASMVHRMGRTTQLRRVALEMEEHGCALAMGVHSSKRFLGVVLLGEKLKGPGYDQSQQEDLQIIVDQFGNAVENSNLYTEIQSAKIYNEILLDNLVSGVVAIDPDKNITVMNREARRIFERVGGSASAKSFAALPEAVREVLLVVLDNGRPKRGMEKEFVAPDGEKVDVTMGGAVFNDETGRQLGALAVLHDVTTERQLASHVQKSEKMATVGRLSASMAHEIKNPLTAIKTFAQLLPERQKDGNFLSNFSELVEGEVDRIASLVSDLLNYARSKDAKFTCFDLHDVIDGAVGLISPEFRKNHIRLSSSYTTKEDTVFGDQDQIRQVLVNLLLNAQQAISGEGSVAIMTEAAPTTGAGRAISLSVSDDGTGMTKEDIEKAFTPFYTTKENGSGLGLAIASTLMDKHKGTIKIASEPGEGTVVRLTFPLFRERKDEAVEVHTIQS